jgi:hypothetical protein
MPFDFGRAARAQAEGKALTWHPAFAGYEPVSTYAAGGQPVRERAVISQREASRHGQAYGGAEAIDWVYDSIGLYADAAAAAPFKLQKEDGTKLVRVKGKGTPPDHQIGPAELYNLLDKPNPYQLLRRAYVAAGHRPPARRQRLLVEVADDLRR